LAKSKVSNFNTSDVITSLEAMKNKLQEYHARYDSCDTIDKVNIEKSYNRGIHRDLLMARLQLESCIESIERYQVALDEGRCFSEYNG